jgi:hypothetical protein
MESGAGSAAGDQTILRVGDLLAPERVRVPLEGLDKESILAELVDLVTRSAGLAGSPAEPHQPARTRGVDAPAAHVGGGCGVVPSDTERSRECYLRGALSVARYK